MLTCVTVEQHEMRGVVRPYLEPILLEMQCGIGADLQADSEGRFFEV